MAHRPVIMANRHAISAGHHLAAQAGHDILSRGGNAIDAGVAAGIVLGVVHSDIVNFAGVAPIIIRLAGSGEVVSIDGLGVWPKLASAELFMREHDGKIPVGIRRTVVPAAPSAWITALQRYGTITFGEAAEAGIRAARDGFGVYPKFAGSIADNEQAYRRWASNREIYLPNDRPPRVGERFVQSDMARSIQYMADQEAAALSAGRNAGLTAAHDAFYRGDIAKTICDYHQANDGLMRMSDMSEFRARLEPPLKVRYAGVDVYGCGAWCQGISLVQTLAMLEQLKPEQYGHNTPEYIHVLTEALKLVFADRERYVGDPAHVDVPVQAMLSQQYAKLRLDMIDMNRAWPEMPPAGDPAAGIASLEPQRLAARAMPGDTPDPHDTRATATLDTSYVCAMDAEGNVFSATPSDSSPDQQVIPGTGFAVSGRGSQSRADPAHAASVAPGKRPRLTPNPALALKDGKPYMAFGTPGGDVQIQAMIQVFNNIHLFGMDPQEAIEAPRFSSYSFPSSFAPNAYYPGLLAVEARVPERTRKTLAGLGHKIQDWPEWTWKAGAVSAIVYNDETDMKYAGADPRRANYALGD